jgi:MFS family permease
MPGDAEAGVIVLSGLSRRRRYLVLAICCLSLFIVGLDATIVNVALPSIGRELHSSVSGLQWTIDAYSLVLASLLMLSGSTADRVGRRRTFQAGLALFTLGSLLCSVAPGLGWLVAFRMLQAVGGSMLNPVAMSIITNTFTEPAERARAIGVWGGVFGLSMAMGPVLGGALVDAVGWRGVFWVNIPVGIAALVLTALFVPESKAARPRRPDPVGQLLVIAMLASLTYAVIEGPAYGAACRFLAPP